MQTRSTTTQYAITERPRQTKCLPLSETKAHLSDENPEMPVLTDVIKSPEKFAARLIPKSTAASPARRVTRTPSSPARRHPSKTRLPSTTIELDSSLAVANPAKRSLGSPIRKTSTSLAVSPHKLQFSAQTLFAVGESTSSLKDAATELQQSLGGRSALKSPARRPQLVPEAAPAEREISVLWSPYRIPRPRTDANVSDQREVLDETSTGIQQPTKPERKSVKTPTRSRSTRRSDGASSKKSCESRKVKPLVSPRRANDEEEEDDDDDDEICLPSYTPIKTPARPVHAQSPPSEDLLAEDDDLWTPSIPTTLTRSFSRLSLSPKPLVKEASHIFFDENGEEMPVSSINVNDLALEANNKSQTSAPKVVVYVDSKTLDAEALSHTTQILHDLGAKTLCRWNWNPETQDGHKRLTKVGLTHVIYFGGAMRTLKKVLQARKLGINIECLAMSWVTECAKHKTLTIDTKIHEIDVQLELSRAKTTKASTIEPSIILQPREINIGPALNAITVEADYLVPVKFADDEENIFASNHKSPQKKIPSSTLSMLQSPSKSAVVTDLELRQLALARRNSAKFRPSISSPLAKKAWRV